MDSFPFAFQFQPQGKVSYCIICRLSVLCCNTFLTSLPVLDQPPFITPEISMSWLMCWQRKQMQVNCCCNQHLYLSSTSRQHTLTLTLPFLSVEALKWIDSLRLSSAEVEEGVDSLAAQARPAAVLLGKRQRYS